MTLTPTGNVASGATKILSRFSRVPQAAAGTPALSAQPESAITTGAFVDLNNPVDGHSTSLPKPTRRAGLYHSLFSGR
ncbi:MAG: hypothetical protein GC179_08735 [Anaerolineaceae bacterium]|nr:hypothetical protein [Anaerolineaceae bacterium]